MHGSYTLPRSSQIQEGPIDQLLRSSFNSARKALGDSRDIMYSYQVRRKHHKKTIGFESTSYIESGAVDFKLRHLMIGKSSCEASADAYLSKREQLYLVLQVVGSCVWQDAVALNEVKLPATAGKGKGHLCILYCLDTSCIMHLFL